MCASSKTMVVECGSDAGSISQYQSQFFFQKPSRKNNAIKYMVPDGAWYLLERFSTLRGIGQVWPSSIRDRLLQLLPFHHHPPEHLKLRHLGAMEYQRYQEPPVEQASLIPPNVPAIDLHLGVPSRRPVGLLPGMWVTWVLKWHMFILRIQDEPGSPKINSDCWAHKMFFIVFRCFSCISLHNVSQACSI